MLQLYEYYYWFQFIINVYVYLIIQDGLIQFLFGSVILYGGGYGIRVVSTESGEVVGYIVGGEFIFLMLLL